MSDNNPWKRLNSKVMYSNPWITVREDQVIRPDGKEGIYGVVQTRLAVGVIALTKNKEVYLIGQYRYPIERYSWEIIEGGSEGNEHALETAKRELLEEGGLEARSWQQLGNEFHLSNCHSDERAVCFLATDLIERVPCPDGNEKLQIKLLPFKDVLSLVHNGEITDALSIISLERLARQMT